MILVRKVFSVCCCMYRSSFYICWVVLKINVEGVYKLDQYGNSVESIIIIIKVYLNDVSC